VARISANDDVGPAQRIYEAIGAIFGLAALALQFYLLFRNASALGRTPAGIVVQFFSYFTILSNILVVLSYGAPLLAAKSALGRFFARPGVKSAIALYIALVGLVYVLVLRQLWDPQGPDKLADAALHYAAPLLYVVYWLAFIDKRRLTYRGIGAWLAFPFVYCVYALVRGALTDIYPYPFLEANKLGYGPVALNIAILVAAFGGFAAILVTAGRALSLSARGPA
jgi:hypothetical protein